MIPKFRRARFLVHHDRDTARAPDEPEIPPTYLGKLLRVIRPFSGHC
jgi:hypothetical protein